MRFIAKYYIYFMTGYLIGMSGMNIMVSIVLLVGAVGAIYVHDLVIRGEL